MKRILRQLDESAARSVERDEFSRREVILLCLASLLVCGFLTFAVVRAFFDPEAGRSLVYFLFAIVGGFWLGAASVCYWGTRWLAHWRDGRRGPPEGRPYQPEQREAPGTESISDEGLTLSWASGRQLGWRDLLACGSLLTVQGALIAGAMWLVTAVGFHLHPDERLTFPRGYPVMACLSLAMVGASFAGRYVWLGVMSRWLSRAEIAPFLAYGAPRRLSRFDRRLLEWICRG